MQDRLPKLEQTVREYCMAELDLCFKYELVGEAKTVVLDIITTTAADAGLMPGPPRTKRTNSG
ncbi:hypothetical protein ColLi_13091 [Colletotrichum liriopes]|uniref:Uncharacterized protein n=1 Tax=Colletotrichum liriopes TaxID=708192 RepID=A0AA37M0A6_9PEZI|nr:hypothetical protein ColLi_13091 [Colletotrichum liriopes]